MKCQNAMPTEQPLAQAYLFMYVHVCRCVDIFIQAWTYIYT